MPAPFPPGACDTHLHFYGAAHAVAPEAILRPPDATPDQYRTVQAALGLERLVIVQPTTYGFDNTCQLEALAEFGAAARAVVVVGPTVTDDELRRLTDLGARGARFHMLAGGAVPWDALDEVARRIAPFGWHVQLQLNGRELPERLDHLRRLPVEVVVDHIGRFMPPVGTDHEGSRALLTLVESGQGWVKLSAPYESGGTGPPDHADLDPIVDALVSRVPERLLWATNWPHPGRPDPPSPEALAHLLQRWVRDTDTRRRVLVDNPAQLYGF